MIQIFKTPYHLLAETLHLLWTRAHPSMVFRPGSAGACVHHRGASSASRCASTPWTPCPSPASPTHTYSAYAGTSKLLHKVVHIWGIDRRGHVAREGSRPVGQREPDHGGPTHVGPPYADDVPAVCGAESPLPLWGPGRGRGAKGKNKGSQFMRALLAHDNDPGRPSWGGGSLSCVCLFWTKALVSNTWRQLIAVGGAAGSAVGRLRLRAMRSRCFAGTIRTWWDIGWVRSMVSAVGWHCCMEMPIWKILVVVYFEGGLCSHLIGRCVWFVR